MVAIDPTPRRDQLGVDPSKRRRPLPLGLDCLLHFLFHWFSNCERFTQLGFTDFTEVVVSVFDIIDAECVEAHDVDACRAVATEHVRHGVYV